MSFSAVLKKYFTGEQTGQLVVKFAQVPNLCKISIEKGEAVYIGIGTLGPEESLEFIADKKPLQANFIPGVPPRRRLPEPLNERLLSIAGSRASAADPVVDPALTAASVAGEVSPQRIEEAIEDFIDQVGPLGRVLAEKALSRVGGTGGEPMPGEMFSSFLNVLHADIPEEGQKEFLARHLK